VSDTPEMLRGALPEFVSFTVIGDADEFTSWPPKFSSPGLNDMRGCGEYKLDL
jgi:hypothetical protein